MPVVWDGDEPAFADAAQAERIQGLIVRRHDQIRHLLAEQPDAYAPWFWADEDDNPIAAAWAEGFLAGIGLRPDAWQPLLESEAGLELVGPIAVFWQSEDGDLPTEDEDELSELQLQMTELIPDAVTGIHRPRAGDGTGAGHKETGEAR